MRASIKKTAIAVFVIVVFSGTAICVAADKEKTVGDSNVQSKSWGWLHPASLDDSLSVPGQDARTPVVAMDDMGNGIVVWSQFDGSYWRIYLAEYGEGQWQKPDSLQNAISPLGGDAKEPRVAMATNGDVVVVWEQLINKDSYIFMAERRAGKWKLPASLDTHISFDKKYAWEPDVAMDAMGNTIVVWSQEYSDSVHVIYKSEYRNGAWVHPGAAEDYINIYGGDGLQPRVAMNNKGEAIITWEQDPGGRSQIYKSEFRKGIWRHPADINDHVSPKSKRGGAHNAIPAMDDAGRTIIAWQQADDPSTRIFMSEYSLGSWRHPKSLSEFISPKTNTHASLNSLAIDARGNAIIIWRLQKKRNQSLYMSQFKDGSWSHPTEEDFFVGSQREFEFRAFGDVALSKGNAVVVWHQRGDDGISKGFLAEYKKGSWSFPGESFNLLGQPVAGASVSSSKRGDFIICWLQKNRIGEIQVYKSEFRLLEK